MAGRLRGRGRQPPESVAILHCIGSRDTNYHEYVHKPVGLVGVSTGVLGVDGMLRGGFWNGSLNIVGGAPGTVKSVFSNHFLHTGLKAGEDFEIKLKEHQCVLSDEGQEGMKAFLERRSPAWKPEG